MTVVDVYNLQKEKVGQVELSDAVFQVPMKTHLLHEVVVAQQAKRRAGTASVKSRSEVQASGRKLYRQKKTGRARAGNAASPTRRGGGVAFGPQPRKYTRKVSRKVRKAALRMALTDKLQTSQLIVIDALELPEVKTKQFVGAMKHFDVRKLLVVTGAECRNLALSSRNVPWVKVMRHEGLNVYDLLRYDHLFLEQSAIASIQEALVS